MKEIAISQFKAKCLSLLDQVHKTKKPIRVTRFGKPVAEVFDGIYNPKKLSGYFTTGGASAAMAVTESDVTIKTPDGQRANTNTVSACSASLAETW